MLHQRLRILIPLLLAALPSLAAETLSLDGAVRIAEQNSPRVEAASERALAARARYRQAMGQLLPSLEVSEVFNRTTSPLENFGMQLSREEFDPAVMAFPDQVNHPDALDTWITRVEARLPLFVGGRMVTGIKQAGLMATAGESERRHTLEEVRLEAMRSWFDLDQVREMVSLLEKAEATTVAHVDKARAYEEEGFLVRSEVLRAEVYLAEVRDLLNSAREGALLAEAALNLRLGLDQDTHWELGETPPLPVQVPELQALVTRALESRGDLDAARQRTEAGRLTSRSSLGALLPSAGVVARYDMFDKDPLGSNASSWSVLAALSWKLNLGGSEVSAWQAARHEARAYTADIGRFEEGVRLQVRQAHSALGLALDQQRTAALALDSGRENLRILEERFTQGVAGTLDVLDARTALRELEIRELVARHDAFVAARSLELLSGASLNPVNNEGE
ncbi:MAG: TolC family protein [Calditrichaeota bacterium]|nr:TolC family protein [Candidatus Cloacimonadota bacterium]MCA9786389.1 TolC family protein [Candidatus Cloacimonadota bacterium]MCB1046493.1 TolC family protein [Calditrichota bacterium]MCB9474512.1 TolC family protein [Candidatus Delongbacteria bacterium]